MPLISTPLAGAKFTLNSAGVAGFFGGKEAISAMATIHLHKNRRWLGWFNSPGSYKIAKRFGRMANSRFWDGLFSGPNDSPGVLFGLDGKEGPKFLAALSGVEMRTGHLGHLTIERSKGLPAKEIPGRKTKPIGVSYLAMKEVAYDVPFEPLPFTPFALIPITVSVVTCIMCALVYDWFSFSMIFLGIISSGWANCVIGKGKLGLRSAKKPTEGSPPGHGILIGESEVVVIKGIERDVDAITSGRLYLERDIVDEEHGAARSNHDIGLCSLLLLVQFLLQLLLIPQGSLFGQIMFLVSLGVSWGYNCYLSSLDNSKEDMEAKIFFQWLVNPQMPRFLAGTRTAMAVFVCLLLFHNVKPEVSLPEEKHDLLIKILRACIPNDTVIWRRWREKVVQQLLDIDCEAESLAYLKEDEKDQALPESYRMLLKRLLLNADSGFRAYFMVRDKLPGDSSLQKCQGKL